MGLGGAGAGGNNCEVCGLRGAWHSTMGGPTRRYYDKDNLWNNRCPECKERWEKEMWDVRRRKRMTRQC